MEYDGRDAPLISRLSPVSGFLTEVARKIREHISALNDGEVASADLELALAALKLREDQLTQEIYRQIGDILRSHATPELSTAFSETLAAMLAAEPTPALDGRRIPLDERYRNLLATLKTGVAADHAGNELLVVLHALSQQVTDQEMVRLTVAARDVLVAAKGKGQLFGTQYGDAMTLCSKHWKHLHPAIAATGLSTQEQAVIARRLAARNPLEIRAAAEDAGTVAWLYEISALLGEDVSVRLARKPVTLRGTHYSACYIGNVLQYLQCGASYNVNQFVRLALPGPVQPHLVIAGEAKGGAGGYGMVRGPRTFMLSQGVASGIRCRVQCTWRGRTQRHLQGANASLPERRSSRRRSMDCWFISQCVEELIWAGRPCPPK